jgi:hypothetical protein
LRRIIRSHFFPSAALSAAPPKEFVMPNQEESKDGVPRKDADRPSPDVERHAPDGQVGQDKNASTSGQPAAQEYRGDGPGKVGLTSDDQPDLVAPSGVNQRDHGVAEDKPMAGGTVNLDDDDMVHPRGKVTGAGRTWNDRNPSDSGELGAPTVGPSDRIGPSDPDTNKRR